GWGGGGRGWGSGVRVGGGGSVARRRSSTLSSTLSTVVLNCATSICQRHRTVYGKCSTEYRRGTQGGLNNTKSMALLCGGAVRSITRGPRLREVKSPASPKSRA